jgi:ABC-type antimicrobial peptide transport system permease subunit
MTSSMHEHEMRRLRHPHTNNLFLSFFFLLTKFLFLFFFFFFLGFLPPLPAIRFDLHQLQNTSVNKPTKTKEHKKLKVPETNKILELMMTLNLWIESTTLPPSAPSLLLSVCLSHTPNCGFLSVSSLSSLSPSPNCGFLSPWATWSLLSLSLSLSLSQLWILVSLSYLISSLSLSLFLCFVFCLLCTAGSWKWSTW